jgi:uncharacterized membrane protein YeaQ/YmgE (transglycosylase-associated protein family)
MNPMLWLVAGSLLGWLANLEMGADRRSSLTLNVLAGVTGSLLAGTLLAPFEPDALAASEVNLGALLVASLGAILLLAVVNLFRLKAP